MTAYDVPRRQFQALFQLRVTFTFVVGYIITNYLFSVALRTAKSSIELIYLLIFFTSPLNLVENFSKVYSSAFQGLLSNFLVTAVMIMLVESYCRIAQIKLRRIFSVDKAFAVAVGASYVVSALTWWFSHFPSSGTSIIGFCMASYLAANCLLDFRAYTARRTEVEFRLKRGLLVACLAISAALIPTGYLIGNAGVYLHLEGLSVFAGGSALVVLRSTRPGPSRAALGGTSSATLNSNLKILAVRHCRTD